MFCSVPVCICSSRSWLFEAGRIVCEGEPLGRCNAAVLFSLLGSICTRLAASQLPLLLLLLLALLPFGTVDDEIGDELTWPSI